ncbi:MAG: trigger factor [Nocardioidaceae bacterium]
MKSAVETLNPTRVKLTVEVPFEELKPSLDAAYKKISQQISVPGFRKGKVPPMIIDQRVGREAVLNEAVTDAVPNLYFQALQDNEITPLGQPELDLGDVTDGADLNFSAELDVKPEVSVPSYAGIEVEVDDMSVGDDEVDEQLELLRERFGSLKPVERAAGDGDFVTIDLSAAKDGEEISEAQASDMSYRVGQTSLLEGLDEALAGMSADEEKTFESTLVGGEFASQQVDVTVKVTAVKEQELPDLDDDFAQQASEFDTIDELKTDLRDKATRGARMEQASAARDAVLDKLLSMADIPLPDGAVGEELKARRDMINQQLAQAGMTEADYLESEGQTSEEFDAELDKRVREAMAAQFLLEEIATAEAVNVEENELTQHLVRRAQQAGVGPEEYIQQVMQENQVPELVSEVRRGKALAQVVENAHVRDTSGNHVELKTLKPDGTYADPSELQAQADAEAEAGAGGGSQAPSTDAAADVITTSEYTTSEYTTTAGTSTSTTTEPEQDSDD